MPTFTGTVGNDTLNGGSDDDTLLGLAGNDNLNGGAGNDVLDGGTDYDVMAGGTGDDLYYVDANTGSTLPNLRDKVIEQPGEGYDRVYIFDDARNWRLDAGAEIEFIQTEYTAYGNEFGQTIYGTRGFGNNGSQFLDGGGGDDILDGFDGNDWLTGGSGADRFIFSSIATDFITDFEVGTDLIVLETGEIGAFKGLPTGALSPEAFTLGAPTTPEHRFILRADGWLVYDPDGNGSSTIGWSFVSVGNIALTASSFLVVEASTVPTLVGTEGNDTLVGKGSNEIIDGRGGDDDLRGGILVYGGAGNDILRGYIMDGGTGDDRFYVSSLDGQVREAVGGGNDRVFLLTNFTELNYALGLGQEIETLSTDMPGLTVAINLAGNEFGQSIYGNNGVNFLDGREGNDVLQGHGGNDILYGGTGADEMYGGTGDDVFYADNIGDQAYEAIGSGNDRIYTTATHVLIAGQEIETLSTDYSAGTAAIDLTGNGFGQYIYGNDGTNLIDGQGGDDYLLGFGGNDRIFGGAGADIMDGGAGDDLIYVDNAYDRVFESIGAGNDRVIASTTYTLAAGQEIETLSTDWTGGSAAIDLAGNERNQNIYGNDGANFLDGREGNDVLQGHGGNDILYGGAGADEMYGGAGDDVFYVDNGSGGGDLAYESVGQGNDRVLAGSSYTLLGGQEIETLSTDWNAGTTGINLTGNEFGQAIYGNAGVNELDGKGGADTLLGGGGADVFLFTTGLGGGNVDQIADFVSGVDDIYLDDAIFSAIGRGALAAGSFATGTAATDADDRIIYDPATGNLFYDADGNGAAAAIMFASLGAQTTLFASDIIVI